MYKIHKKDSSKKQTSLKKKRTIGQFEVSEFGYYVRPNSAELKCTSI